jgi:hypothetical protein
VKFRNQLERAIFEAAENVCGSDATIEHNRVIEIDTADSIEVASFSGPPKKEIDVITAGFAAAVKILISCKQHAGKSQPTDVQEWSAVVGTLNRYAKDTRFLGLVISPSGFTSGCEAWATAHNLGLIPPLKGNDFRFSESSAVQMCRRALGAFARRITFPSGELFTPPGFYDFVFDLIADFEGRERQNTDSHGARYSLLETGWLASFGELVSTLLHAEIQDIIATSKCLGLRLSGDLLFLSMGEKIAFGNGQGFRPPGKRMEPACTKNPSFEPWPFADLFKLVSGRKLRSAADFGTHFEFGLSNDVNLGFYPGMLHVIRTLNPPNKHLL